MTYAKLYDTSFGPAPFSTLKLTVQRYSAAAVGGHEQAEIEVSGAKELLREVQRWLGYYVVIYSDRHSIVWFGKVMQTTTRRGKRALTKSLDEMANRITVAYSYDDANGDAQRGTTAAADDTNSQYLYGIKEQLQNQGDTDANQAAALRDNALTQLSMPIKTISLGGGNGAGGSLLCRGLWSTLGWRLFNQLGGYVAHDVTGTVEHLLGWGLTTNTIGFLGTANRIHDIGARLEALRQDDVIVVSGAATGGNNGQFTIEQTATLEPKSYTAGTIRFEASDDIIDTASGLDFVQSNEMIKISGSAVGGNNRYYYAKDDVAAAAITVNPNVTASAAGPAITIQQGHNVGVTTALVTEFPAATVTLTALGAKIAQSFTLPVNVPFLLAEVHVRVKRVGNPSDNLTVAIYADSGGAPGALIESSSVIGNTLGEDMNWRQFIFSITSALTYGAAYWSVVARTGVNDPENYYLVDISEDATYAGGAFKLWNGSAWVSRSPDADMPFQVYAHRQTSDQIGDMLSAGGQFFVAQDIVPASGRHSRQYRNSDQTAQAEIETLLRAGVSGGRRYLANVTPDRVVHVYQEPVYDSSTAPLLTETGEILETSGAAPWELGKLPAGMWLTQTDELPDDSPVFIERAEFDAVSGEYSALETRGAPNPWDVVKLA